MNVLKGIIFIESTFNNFINFVLFFPVHYCSSAVLLLFLNPDQLFTVTVMLALLKLDICTEDRRKELPSCLTLMRRRYYCTVNRSLPSVGVSVSFCKSMTFLFGSTFFIRQDMVTLSTKPQQFWEVPAHTQWIQRVAWNVLQFYTSLQAGLKFIQTSIRLPFV